MPVFPFPDASHKLIIFAASLHLKYSCNPGSLKASALLLLHNNSNGETTRFHIRISSNCPLNVLLIEVLSESPLILPKSNFKLDFSVGLK